MFFKKEKLKLSPLHNAIIENNRVLTAQLKESEWSCTRDSHGFTPLELAQLLGRKECQEILAKKNLKLIKVQFPDQQHPRYLSVSAFEARFKLIYRPFLTFPSYQILEEVISNCSYLLRLEQLLDASDEQEISYQKQCAQAVYADVSVKWMNSTKGYGLFADVELPKNSFIAEYTGKVKKVTKTNPAINAYCFEYPTKFWASDYYVIDSIHKGNLSRFINHSDQPNLQPLWMVNRGIAHLIFIAKVPIAKGSELTFNYGPDYWRHRNSSV